MDTDNKQDQYQSGVPDRMDDIDVEAEEFAISLIRKHPPDFKPLPYIQHLKKNIIANVKEELLVKKRIEPFYNALPHKERKWNKKDRKGKEKEKDTEDIFVYPELELSHEKTRIETLIMKVKATVSYVLLEKKLPKKEHLLFLRSLSQHIIEILKTTGHKAEPKYRETLLSAAHTINHLFEYSLGDSECVISLSEAGIELMLKFLVEFITIDYKNAAVQMSKYELVSDIMYYLKLIIIRRKMFEILCLAIKCSLNRVNRASRNEKNDCVLPMEEVETLFRYLMILENVVYSLPQVKEEELSTLQSLERTILGAMKYPLIGLYMSRIATFAANTPPYVEMTAVQPSRYLQSTEATHQGSPRVTIPGSPPMSTGRKTISSTPTTGPPIKRGKNYYPGAFSQSRTRL